MYVFKTETFKQYLVGSQTDVTYAARAAKVYIFKTDPKRTNHSLRTPKAVFYSYRVSF